MLYLYVAFANKLIDCGRYEVPSITLMVGPSRSSDSIESLFDLVDLRLVVDIRFGGFTCLELTSSDRHTVGLQHPSSISQQVANATTSSLHLHRSSIQWCGCTRCGPMDVILWWAYPAK